MSQSLERANLLQKGGYAYIYNLPLDPHPLPQAGQDLADHLLMERDKIELHTPSTP